MKKKKKKRTFDIQLQKKRMKERDIPRINESFKFPPINPSVRILLFCIFRKRNTSITKSILIPEAINI